MVLLRDGRHGLCQHAINTELDRNRIVASLDMNVAGTPLQRCEDSRVHEPDNRAHVTLSSQLVDRDALVAAFFLTHKVQREAFASVLEHTLGLLGLLKN